MSYERCLKNNPFLFGKRNVYELYLHPQIGVKIYAGRSPEDGPAVDYLTGCPSLIDLDRFNLKL